MIEDNSEEITFSSSGVSHTDTRSSLANNEGLWQKPILRRRHAREIQQAEASTPPTQIRTRRTEKPSAYATAELLRAAHEPTIRMNADMHALNRTSKISRFLRAREFLEGLSAKYRSLVKKR